MVMKGETVATGATLEACEFCGVVPQLQVCHSAAGFYVGYWCCMPYSRESGYYPSWKVANAALESGVFGR